VGNGREVLNVNDDDAARYVVSRLLRHAGYEVIEARTGREALMLARRLPSLIVLDVKLPDLSGLDVCRALKADPLTAFVPILQTSATFTSAERRVQGLDSGADGYLAQPIEPPELLATVRALIRTHEAEDENRLLAHEWRQSFDAIGDAVALVDDTSRIVRCNRRMLALASRDREDLAGYPIEAAFPDLPHGVVPALVQAAREQRRRQTAEAKAGDRWYRIVADPALDRREEPVDRIVVVLTDVTDLKRLEEEQRIRAEQLAVSNQRKDEFLAMLAHELRNPLNAIAAANGLQDRLGAQDAQNVRLRETVSRHVRKLARLIDDLLEVTRLTRGAVELERKSVDVSAVVREAVQVCRSRTEARRQPVHLDIAGEPLTVMGDPLRLEQALANLVENAAKYSEPGSPIVVSARSGLDDTGCAFAEVSVRDQGFGLTAEQIEAVFEPFVQAHQTLARSAGGIGMGLTIARQLVEMHGGTLTAHSDGPGLGSEFRLRLPLAATEETQEPVEEPTMVPADDGGVLDVLVIEDESDTAWMLSSLIEARGHSVRVCTNGLAGLEAALARLPQVAFVDVGLPGLDGYAIAERLRRTKDGASLLLVAVTGYGRQEDRARALAAGFDLHLVKPLDLHQLSTILRRRAAGSLVRSVRASAAVVPEARPSVADAGDVAQESAPPSVG
jgi:PAS domain S-box-containing protein